ncbi:synapsin-1-like [Lagopus muta]|uniref:synapsin-1-like n=1 Tax=Lagopus muta TaxID=64668 RepID=UPI0020A13E03|nr:synapsin-1-like [Lagopus muta]
MNSWEKAQEETLHIFFCSKLGMKPEKLEGKCAAAKEKEVYYGYCILNTPITQSSKTASKQQFWKLCITSCHRRQPAGAAHKQTPATPPAPKRGEPRGAAPTDGRGEESPCRQRVPWAATRRFVSHRKRRGRPREAQTVTGLRDPAAAGRGARGRSRLGGRGAPAAASAFQRPPRRSIFPRRTPRAERRTAGGRSPPGAAPRPRQVCTAPPTWPLSPRAPLNSPSAGGRGGAGHTHREGPLHLLPAAPPPPNPGPSDNLCPVPTRAIFTLSKRFFRLRVPTGARRSDLRHPTALPPPPERQKNPSNMAVLAAPRRALRRRGAAARLPAGGGAAAGGAAGLPLRGGRGAAA